MPETTYLYMQGHHVMDNVVMKLLIPVCTALRREREQEIKRLAEHNEQFRNELTCYQNSQVNVEIMLKKNGSHTSERYKYHAGGRTRYSTGKADIRFPSNVSGKHRNRE